MKNKAIIILSMLLSVFWFSSCENSDNLSQMSNDDISSIVDMIDLFDTDDVEEATSDDTKSSVEYGRCFELIFYPNESGEFWPRSWTLDFGDGSCESPNGTVRSGKINVTLTDCWINEGSLRTITYEEFYINDNHLEGTKTIENTGINENENPSWEWNVIDGKITDAEGNLKTWNATRYSEMVEGADTREFIDNVFDGSETIIIDYGDGECDNTATMQIGETVEEITLGRR